MAGGGRWAADDGVQVTRCWLTGIGQRDSGWRGKRTAARGCGGTKERHVSAELENAEHLKFRLGARRALALQLAALAIRTLSKLEPTGRCLHEASAALRRHVRTCVTRRTWRTGVSPILGAGNRARARLGQALSAHLARMSGAWCRVRLGHAPVGDTAPRPRVPDCRSCARRTQTHSSCAHCAGPAGQPVRTVTLAHGARVGRHAE